MNQKTKLLHGDLTGEILKAFLRVYNTHGYGFLEAVYMNSLSLELRSKGLRVEREAALEVQYLGQPVGHYRVDMIVNRLVLIEGKAGALLVDADRKQLFNYVRASRLEVGLLLHFGPEPVSKRIVIPRTPAVSAVSDASA